MSLPDKIEEMYACLSMDRSLDGSMREGVVALWSPKIGWTPLVFADKANLPETIRKAREIASSTNKSIRLVKFTVREELQVIEP